MTKAEIKQYLTDKKVCIATNSPLSVGCLLYYSQKTYLDYIPEDNYLIIPGMIGNVRNYGINAFMQMLDITLHSNRFDYIIYIDEDCFINNFEKLIEEFNKFIDGNKYCLAGIQDGGCICHRNHSKILVNTFLSFWNIKALKKNVNVFTSFNNYINMFKANNGYQLFLNNISKELLNKMNDLALSNIENVKQYRLQYFDNGMVPYCDIVKNDINNSVEPRQIPYSYKDDNFNFEPYYVIEEAMILATNLPIYYFKCTDLYNKNNNTELDNTGITSVVMDSDNNFIAYHTWFSRLFNLHVNNSLCIYHTDRIMKIINYFKK